MRYRLHCFIFAFILLKSLSLLAIDEQKFVEANILYSESKFEEALKAYRELEKSKLESSSLFYNMGNTHFRLSNIGFAILYYKKALLLNPLDGDIRSNLNFVRQETVDRIEASTETEIKSIFFFWYYLFNLKILVALAVISSLIMWTVLTVKIFKRGEVLNWLFIISFGFFILFTVSGAIKFYEYKINLEGVIIIEEIQVKSSANEKGIALFNLHEGTEVRIKNEFKGYYRIELKDKKSGWVKKEFIGVV